MNNEENSNPQLRSELIAKHLPLVAAIAKQFLAHSHGEPLEDLIQVGNLGLIKAVDRFDPSQAVQFTTYATHQITGEIKHYLRDKTAVIRPPRWLRHLTYQIFAEAEKLAQKLGRFPTEKEIAENLNVEEEGVLEILKLRQDLSCARLDVPQTEQWERLQKKIRSRNLTSFQLPIEDKIVLSNAIEKLLKLEKQALYLFFYQDLTQTEIGKLLGMRQRTVSRLIERGLKRLKSLLS